MRVILKSIKSIVKVLKLLINVSKSQKNHNSEHSIRGYQEAEKILWEIENDIDALE